MGGRLAEKAKDAVFEKLAFDRGGRKYHGRVRALAQAAREGGLQVLTDMVNMEKTNKQEKSEFIEK